MVRRLGLSLGLAISLCGGTVRADGDSTEEVLKRLFPDRDLSQAAVKVVNQADRCYIVADAFEILANGNVRVTNGVVMREISDPNLPNQPTRYSSIEGARMVLKFKKPVKQLADLKGNALVGSE
jgi:hypothetical protein